MKRVFLLFVTILVAYGAMAQSKTTTQIGSLNIIKERPVLEVVDGSVKFIEKNGNNAIDANERCYIEFEVLNRGLGDAYGYMTKINVTGSVEGLSFSESKDLDIIGASKTTTVIIPIDADMNTVDGLVHISIMVDEPNGLGTALAELAINTKRFEAPLLKIVDYTVTGKNSSVLSRRMPFDLQLLLQNTEHGYAEDVKVEIIVPTNVIVLENDSISEFNQLGGGDKKSLEYGLIVNNNYALDTIAIVVNISEKYGKYSERKIINLRLNQTFASNKIVLEERSVARGDIQIGSLGSDVDKDIPVTGIENNKTFAVIISNEDYQRVGKVPFAFNDGRVFAEYCKKTLGIPDTNIKFLPNATLGNMKAEVNWLSNVIKAYNGEAKVIFYYAGHGIPDESDRTAYLLPVDGYGSDVSTGYKLDELYSTLGKLPTESVTIFLDACFSGSNRQGSMLTSARGIAIRAKSCIPVGNMVVFSAAQGDETAYPYQQQQHGMFTYYLLKKLQSTKGAVSYQELANYITMEVSRQSIVLNGKSQTPTIIASPNVSMEWSNWKMY